MTPEVGSAFYITGHPQEHLNGKLVRVTKIEFGVISVSLNSCCDPSEITIDPMYLKPLEKCVGGPCAPAATCKSAAPVPRAKPRPRPEAGGFKIKTAAGLIPAPGPLGPHMTPYGPARLGAYHHGAPQTKAFY